jgi:hypothetical protein
VTKYVVMAGWDDVPHLSPEAKKSLAEAYPPHERDARMRGLPRLGSGAIYPVPEEDLLCAPFELPKYWKHAYALDVGWNRTAALWGALDPEADVLYLYSEHYRGEVEPAVHAQAIRARGAWIPGVHDPAARGRSQIDGTRLSTMYQGLGLRITPADNAVEAGIYEVWSRMSSGRLKIFSTLVNLMGEFRIYRRDDKGKVVKSNDHLMDCLRYLVMSGLPIAAFRPLDSDVVRQSLWPERKPREEQWTPRAALDADHYGMRT